MRALVPLYPLQFEPIFRRYLWGGRRLGEVLGRPIGEGHDYAESWETVDRGSDQSRVAAGPLAGATLNELVVHRGDALLGRHAGLEAFPLLFKFLDAHQSLSVQVHPSDEQAANLNPPDRGKTEAWVVLEAAPGSRIYAGLKRSFDRQALSREVARGTTELCLHHFEPRAGDCVYIPAGTIHALGAGLLVAEIQQSSDTTFRLFDWNRTGPDGRPRPLHIAQALATIDYGRGPVQPQVPRPGAQPGLEQLVDCGHFVLNRWQLNKSGVVGGDDRCHLLVALDGQLTVHHATHLRRGQVMLLPAVLGAVTLAPLKTATFLEIHLP